MAYALVLYTLSRPINWAVSSCYKKWEGIPFALFRKGVMQDQNKSYHTFERLVGVALTVLLALALVGITSLLK